MGVQAVRTNFGVLVSAALALAGQMELSAQERLDGPRKDKSSVTTRFFERPIDFWDRGLTLGDEPSADPRQEKGKDEKPAKKSAGSEWGQVVKLPDGTVTYHELPGPLVQVLENPTPENIRAYFDWRMEKAGKVLRAAQLMKEYRESMLGSTERAANPHDPAGRESSREAPVGPPTLPALAPHAEEARKSTPFTVTYFHRKNCPHCDTEDQILGEWLQDKPEGRLDVVEFGMRPELWQALKIRGTPSLLLEDPETKKRVFLEGVNRVQALDQALGECRRTEERNGPAKGDVGK
jgi:hypothetical protein